LSDLKSLKVDRPKKILNFVEAWLPPRETTMDDDDDVFGAY